MSNLQLDGMLPDDYLNLLLSDGDLLAQIVRPIRVVPRVELIPALKAWLAAQDVPPEPPSAAFHQVTAFVQSDPRWGTLPLGQSDLTMKSAGCAVTGVAMLGAGVDMATSPGVLCSWLNAHDGFTPEGLLYWARAAEAVAGMEFVRYVKWHDRALTAAEMQATLELLAVKPLLLQVDYRPGGPLNSHFAVAIGYDETRQDIRIVDPVDGATKWLLESYGAREWDLPRAIYALVEFKL